MIGNVIGVFFTSLVLSTMPTLAIMEVGIPLGIALFINGLIIASLFTLTFIIYNTTLIKITKQKRRK